MRTFIKWCLTDTVPKLWVFMLAFLAFAAFGGWAHDAAVWMLEHWFKFIRSYE